MVPATKELTAESSQCEICQFAAEELFSILKDPYDQVSKFKISSLTYEFFQRMVENVLESICYRLPNSVERRCEQVIHLRRNSY